MNSDIEKKWQDWLFYTRDRCHLNFELFGGTIQSHVKAGNESGRLTAKRIKTDLDDIKPARILEVGCSVGFNCLGLANEFEEAFVFGIEPDQEAIDVANAMSNNSDRLKFLQGYGENLPFDDNYFDLIICHTVIEHVQDVPSVIKEMQRVLKKNGTIHLEAPNYAWPYEPHLGIFCIPLLGKTLTRGFALIQGKEKQISYLEHLQFVYPNMLQRLFAENKLSWENKVELKIDRVISGNYAVVKKYKKLAVIISILNKLKLSWIVKKFIISSQMYPSVLYTLKKN